MTRPRVMMLGLRSIPEAEGGIERHVEHLAPRLVDLGCDVTVIARTAYHPRDKPVAYRDVKLLRVWSPRSRSFETILHTLLGTVVAAVHRPDVLHVHAIGPALYVPLARLLGLRVVVTHHGPDYDREKWGTFAKTILRLGERVGMRWANARIVISRTIQTLVQRKHGCDSHLIPNGVELPALPDSTGALAEFGLEPGRYVVLVSRMVPEKRHLDLITAFGRASLAGWKLALVGSLDADDEYVRNVRADARRVPGVVLTGFQSGRALAELFRHAGCFVLPSTHEGLPIALLEALSYGLPVVASDIAANLELGLPAESYFPVGDLDALAARLRSFDKPESERERTERVARTRAWVAERYDWDVIAKKTLEVYRALVPADRRR